MTQRIVGSTAVLVTICITVGVTFYIDSQVDAIKQDAIYKRRKARQAKLLRAAAETSLPYTFSRDNDPEDPRMPLAPNTDGQYSYTPQVDDESSLSNVPTRLKSPRRMIRHQEQQPPQ